MRFLFDRIHQHSRPFRTPCFLLIIHVGQFLRANFGPRPVSRFRSLRRNSPSGEKRNHPFSTFFYFASFFSTFTQAWNEAVKSWDTKFSPFSNSTSRPWLWHSYQQKVHFLMISFDVVTWSLENSNRSLPKGSLWQIANFGGDIAYLMGSLFYCGISGEYQSSSQTGNRATTSFSDAGKAHWIIHNSNLYLVFSPATFVYHSELTWPSCFCQIHPIFSRKIKKSNFFASDICLPRCVNINLPSQSNYQQQHH